MRTPISALATLLFLLLASAASAQSVPSPTPPTTRLAFTHDGLNTEGYKLQVDGGPKTVITVTPLVGVPGDLVTPFPALTPGSHTLTIFAFNADIDVEGTPTLSVRIFIAPVAPTNFRLLALEARPAPLMG